MKVASWRRFARRAARSASPPPASAWRSYTSRKAPGRSWWRAKEKPLGARQSLPFESTPKQASQGTRAWSWKGEREKRFRPSPRRAGSSTAAGFSLIW